MSAPLRKSEHESHLAQRRANLRDERRLELVKAMVTGTAAAVVMEASAGFDSGPANDTLIARADAIIDALEARRNEEAKAE